MKVPPFSIVYDVVAPFLFGSVLTCLFSLLIFASMGWISLKPHVIEHPDGWYHIESMCHKTRVGGYDWKEECVPVRIRPR